MCGTVCTLRTCLTYSLQVQTHRKYKNTSYKLQAQYKRVSFEDCVFFLFSTRYLRTHTHASDRKNTRRGEDWCRTYKLCGTENRQHLVGRTPCALVAGVCIACVLRGKQNMHIYNTIPIRYTCVFQFICAHGSHTSEVRDVRWMRIGCVAGGEIVLWTGRMRREQGKLCNTIAVEVVVQNVGP